MATILTNICATRYDFIDKKFAETVCQVLKIEPQRLIKLKQIQRFDSLAAKSITHTIYPTLTIGTHTESFASLLITKLRSHLMILGQPWIKKHEIIIDMINNFLAFWPSYYIHIEAISPTTLSQLRLPTRKAVVRIDKDIISLKIIKKGSKEDMIDFF